MGGGHLFDMGDSAVKYSIWKRMLHLDHIASVMVVAFRFQFQSPSTSEINELEYDNSESESTSACAESHLSSPASQFQSSLKSSCDGHLKGPYELLSKTPPRLHPLTTSQSAEESIVDQEGKWAYVFVKNF